jgi:hypothetical protein
MALFFYLQNKNCRLLVHSNLRSAGEVAKSERTYCHDGDSAANLPLVKATRSKVLSTP